MKNSVPVEKFIVGEIRVLQELDWQHIYIMCPLDIINNAVFLLNLEIKGMLNEMLFFTENITNFIIWNEWGEYSVFSIAISALIAFFELNDTTMHIQRIMKFVIKYQGPQNQELVRDTIACRKFIFENLGQLSDDVELIQKATNLNQLDFPIHYGLNLTKK